MTVVTPGGGSDDGRPGTHADPTAPWRPLSVPEVVAVFQGLTAPWWVAGGRAIDLAAGRTTRLHADTDVLVLRRDLGAVCDHLRGWDFHAADPPGTLRPWPAGEPLPDHVHDVWCRSGSAES